MAATTRALLGKPLAMDDAVRIAPLNHPGLKASYWNVGIAQADLAPACRTRASVSSAWPAVATSRSNVL